MTFDSMRVALRGILANRMRSALTMLGILIGTAAVILLVAVGTGISNQVQVQIRNLVAPTVGSSGTVTWNGMSYALQNFIGGSPEFGEIRNTPVERGRFLTE